MIAELTPAAVSERLQSARPGTTWCARVRQAPPYAPRTRVLHCAWLADQHGILGFAADAPLPPPPADRAGFIAHAHAHGCVPIDPDAPIELAPVDVPKAWGREVWFTGIEPRGESQIVAGGRRAPLGYALALFPELCGASPPLLMKALHAYHEPLVGELYFEVHATKREAYFVTDVDRRAWPTGCAEIRFGLDPRALRDRAAFMQLLRRFEAARRAIDRAARIEGAAITPARHLEARRRVPSTLLAVEHGARTAVEALITSQSIAPGTRLEVPPGTPHGLRHGISVIEVQTPSYERAVLYSSQPLSTQDAWDIERGIALIGAPSDTPPIPARWEALDGGAALRLGAGRYVLCHVVSGRLRAGELGLGPGGTCLARRLEIRAEEPTRCVVVEAH